MMAAQAPRAATQSAAPAGYGAAAKPVQALSQMGMVAAPAEDVDDFLHDIAMLEEHRDFAALARGLATHARNAEAAVAACRSLGLICRADNRNEVARSAALHVVAAMDAHAKDGAVQAEACAALAMMALNSQEGKTQILDAGAFPRIAEAMEVHDEDRQVQAMACYAIMSATNRATRAAIIEANAASCIILAALRYPVDFYVQDAAWWALQRILKDMTPEERAKLLGTMFKAALLVGTTMMASRNNLELAQASPIKYVAQEVSNLVRRAMKDSKATDKTKEMGRILLTALEEAATIVSEEDVNDEGNPVKPSPLPAHGHQYYCGQKRPIPGSDGRCGPTNGPQCPSCVRFTQAKGADKAAGGGDGGATAAASAAAPEEEEA